MTMDLSTAGEPWLNPGAYWPRLDAATAHLDPVFGVIDRGALAHNAHDLARRAHGTPIRVASKSVRVREVLDAVLALDGYRGVLAYTLPEAVWLARHGIDDVVVAYPTAHRAALAELGSDADLAARVTIMIDSGEQLDFVDAVVAPARRAAIRVCLELDASLDTPVLGRVGVLRSPVRDAGGLGALAAQVVARDGFSLVGVMAYEAQVAGVSNAGLGKVAIRAMQRASIAELGERRAAAVARVRDIAGEEFEFVNGGGTGSIESTRDDPSITEIAAGSGLFGGHFFDNYRAFSPAPAAAFALPIVRRPRADVATALGGGWIASGPPAADRLPLPVWPPGLSYAPREMAGEVQTPLTGAAASGLRVGDRVWMRHAKSGEIAEHLDEMHLVDGDEVIARVPTYRGERQAFL